MPPSPDPARDFHVSPADAGRPLLDFLRDRLDLSGRRAKALLDARNVFVNGKRIWMAKHTLGRGDIVAVNAPPTPPRETAADLPLLHADDWLVAVDKPAGLVSDRAADSVEARLRAQLDLPALRALHRLDRDTSGVMLFNRQASEREPYLNLFRNKEIDKIYLGIFRGRPDGTEITVDQRLDGKEAATHFRVVRRRGDYFLAECRIPTGRKHQIRRHALSADWTLVGDSQYAPGREVPKAERAVGRQMLHAVSVRLPCPHTRRNLHIEAPPPPDFRAAVKHFGLQ